MREFPHLDWKRTPVTLIIATIVIGLEIACTLDELLRGGGLRVSLYNQYFGINRLIWLGEPWRPFTCALMHGDVLHAAFNIYWFLIFGPVLERWFGSLKYLGLIVLLGYVSMMLEYVIGSYNRLDPIMIVGLSGVIYGMFGLVFVGRKSNSEMAAVCTDATRSILIGWFFICIALTYLNIMRIANLAHGTGFVFGVVYGYAAFGGEKKQRLGWLCGATFMTAVVLAMLIWCPGHEQYEQAQKWKALRMFGASHDRGRQHARLGYAGSGRAAPGWTAAGFPAVAASIGSLQFLAAETIDPVEAGRRGFVSDWHSAPPWYDTSKDAAKPVDLREPWWEKREREERTGPAPDGSWLRGLGWTLVIVVVGLVVFALVQAFRSGMLVDAGSNKRPKAEADKHRIEALPFPVDTFDGDFFKAAETHYRAGRYGEATKFLFCYQLVELDRARCIRLAQGKTNRRYLREIRGRVTLAPWIEDTMVAFEDYFFGNHRIDRTRFERCWAQLPKFREFLRDTHKAGSVE